MSSPPDDSKVRKFGTMTQLGSVFVPINEEPSEIFSTNLSARIDETLNIDAKGAALESVNRGDVLSMSNSRNCRKVCSHPDSRRVSGEKKSRKKPPSATGSAAVAVSAKGYHNFSRKKASKSFSLIENTNCQDIIGYRPDSVEPIDDQLNEEDKSHIYKKRKIDSKIKVSCASKQWTVGTNQMIRPVALSSKKRKKTAITGRQYPRSDLPLVRSQSRSVEAAC